MTIKTVFFATPDIALQSLSSLFSDKDFELSALVCQKPKPSGRGKKITQNNLIIFAKEHNIEIIETEKISKDADAILKLKNMNADFFVTFAFGQILSQEIIDIPKYGIINLHASILPRYRGANPIRQAIMDGCQKTGVTTMLTCLEMDEGDICLCEEISLTENTNSIELTEKISNIAPNLIKKTLLGLVKGKIEPKKQNHSLATYTKKTKKEDKIINWKDSAENIHNKIRALVDNFTCQTNFNGKIIKILKTEVCKSVSGEAGKIMKIDKEGILVCCGKDSVILKKVKPEGKGEMEAYSWSLGTRLKAGDKFDKSN